MDFDDNFEPMDDGFNSDLELNDNELETFDDGLPDSGLELNDNELETLDDGLPDSGLELNDNDTEEIEFPSEAEDEGYFETIPNEIEPYVMDEANAEISNEGSETEELDPDAEIQEPLENDPSAIETDNADLYSDETDVSPELSGEETADVRPEEAYSDVAPEITEADDATVETSEGEKTPYEAMKDYLFEHNYSKTDYPEYSQDPEWQALNEAYKDSLENKPELDPNAEIREPFENDPSATETDNAVLNNNETGELQDNQNIDNNKMENLNVNDWISEINPHFDPYDLNSAYDNNCGSCAFAVHQRFEGDMDIVATTDNIGTIEEMNAVTGMEQVAMTPDEIQQTLLDQGNGAHAIIGIDRADGPGHWFNAANIDGKVVAIDGQTGEITDWPPDYGDVTNWDMSMKKGNTV